MAIYINQEILQVCMNLENAISKLKSSKEFKEWFSNNKDAYMTYAFIMAEENCENSSRWQIGYYNRDNRKVTAFNVDKNCVSAEKEQDIFNKPDAEVKEIDLGSVKIGFSEAIEKADGLREKEYSGQHAMKRIAILQNIDAGQVWNITFVTSSFKTLNVKVDAGSGEVISHELISLFEFK